MQQEGIVAILGRRNPVIESMKFVGLRIEPIGPRLGGERRIRGSKVARAAIDAANAAFDSAISIARNSLSHEAIVSTRVLIHFIFFLRRAIRRFRRLDLRLRQLETPLVARPPAADTAPRRWHQAVMASSQLWKASGKHAEQPPHRTPNSG